MARALIAAFFLSFFALSAHAQDSSVTLSLIRAVRLSDTSITISFRTNEPSVGEVAYTAADSSKFTLTDSAPQMDHLFTIDQLDPHHGYSFVLTASTNDSASDIYTVLLAPASIGAPGASILPSVQETNATGIVVSSTLAASSAPAATKPLAPWWVFAILFVLVIGGWVGYRQYSRRAREIPPMS